MGGCGAGKRLRAQHSPPDRAGHPAIHPARPGLALVALTRFLLEVKVAAHVNPCRHLLFPRGNLGQIDVLIAPEFGRVAAQ